jgi:hypothetical protein
VQLCGHTTKIEQVLGRLLAEMNVVEETMEAKIGAVTENIREKMYCSQE